ncbi:Uncharacterised protein [uncultured archaeon]|nr:Uncharacterised protein [uncultured archaeon]
MRSALALLATTKPAFANSGSTVFARSVGRAEKTMSASTFFGSTGTTVTSVTSSGILLSSLHLAASPYFLPALLSEAARDVISNHGCLLNISINL